MAGPQLSLQIKMKHKMIPINFAKMMADAMCGKNMTNQVNIIFIIACNFRSMHAKICNLLFVCI